MDSLSLNAQIYPHHGGHASKTLREALCLENLYHPVPPQTLHSVCFVFTPPAWPLHRMLDHTGNPPGMNRTMKKTIAPND